MTRLRHTERNFKAICVFCAILFAITGGYLIGVLSNEPIEKQIIYSKNDDSEDYMLINNRTNGHWMWYVQNKNPNFIFQNDQFAWEDDRKIYKGINIHMPKTNVHEYRRSILAVIDCGVKQELLNKKRIWYNTEETLNNYDDDNNGFVDDYYGYNFVDDANVFNDKKDGPHGTYISSLLIGHNKKFNYSGLLCGYNVKVMNLKALSGVQNSGDIENIIKAIMYAENMGADVCCLCANSCFDSEELYNVIKSSKMLFVVPAGNDGKEIGEAYSVFPSCYNFANVICVGDIRMDGRISKSSNYSKENVDVMAPGTDVIGIYSDNSLISLSGTSAATAICSAGVVCIRNLAKEKLTPDELKSVLCENVTQLKSLKNRCRTSGYININKALKGL